MLIIHELTLFNLQVNTEHDKLCTQTKNGNLTSHKSKMRLIPDRMSSNHSSARVHSNKPSHIRFRFRIDLLITIIIVASEQFVASVADCNCPPHICLSTPRLLASGDSKPTSLATCKPPMVKLIGPRSRTEKRSRRMRFETLAKVTASDSDIQCKLCHVWSVLKENCERNAYPYLCEHDQVGVQSSMKANL